MLAVQHLMEMLSVTWLVLEIQLRFADVRIGWICILMAFEGQLWDRILGRICRLLEEIYRFKVQWKDSTLKTSFCFGGCHAIANW
jgi:hypothetical protein